MAIPLNDNVKVIAPKPSDPRFFAPDNTPWSSIVAVEAGIPLTERHPELEVDVMGTIYWWKDGAWEVKNDTTAINNHISNTSNPHNVTKTQVGLSNVDNTSDANKPISTAQQTALNAKEPTITAGTTAQYYRGDKTWQNLSNLVTQVEDEFYYDENSILRPNISTYRQVELNNTSPIPIITLDFEPTFIQSVNVNGVILTQNQYIYTAPNQLDLSDYTPSATPMTIEIIYDHFITDNNPI